MPLTDVAVRAAKPTEKTQKIFDGGGLYLEISPSGGKWWRLKYRFGGKEKRISLGVYPDTSLKEARDRRDEARKLLANDIDPGENRKAQKAARVELESNSFEAVAREWFAKNKPTWAASHADKIISRLENDVFPWLGSMPISEITAPQVLTVLRRIESRGTIDTAHRAKGNCGQVFRYAVATGRAERDPSADLRDALPPLRHEHFASITDPLEVAGLLRAIDAFKGTFVVRSALLLSPLLFTRPGELRTAEWSGFDLEKAEWRYFVTKTKTDQLVPLATQGVMQEPSAPTEKNKRARVKLRKVGNPDKSAWLNGGVPKGAIRHDNNSGASAENEVGKGEPMEMALPEVPCPLPVVQSERAKKNTVILRLKQVTAKTGLSRSTIYDKLNPKSPRYDATFPKQIALGQESVGWVEAEIEAWLESRIFSARLDVKED